MIHQNLKDAIARLLYELDKTSNKSNDLAELELVVETAWEKVRKA